MFVCICILYSCYSFVIDNSIYKTKLSYVPMLKFRRIIYNIYNNNQGQRLINTFKQGRKYRRLIYNPSRRPKYAYSFAFL